MLKRERAGKLSKKHRNIVHRQQGCSSLTNKRITVIWFNKNEAVGRHWKGPMWPVVGWSGRGAVRQHTDITGVAQLCVWLRLPDQNTFLEKVLSLVPPHGQTGSEDSLNTLLACLDEKGLVAYYKVERWNTQIYQFSLHHPSGVVCIKALKQWI